jgi:protocatechuate 3,4-dioxygenase beta subunit
VLRRRFLGGAAITGGIGSLSSFVFARDADEFVMPSGMCRPTVRQTLGPYLTPNSSNRSDIREERSGVPLHLTLNVVDDYFCKPIEGATIEIWHSDAGGLYSGVDNIEFDLTTMLDSGKSIDTRGKSFLRGHQTTGPDGRVHFTTIVPGWYTGRLAHIHLQTIIQGLAWTSHVTQLYLPQDIEQSVYKTDAYRPRGQNPIGINRDLVVRGDAASVKQLTIPLEKHSDGYRGEYDLAVAF